MKLVQYVPAIEPPEKVTSFVADAVPEPAEPATKRLKKAT